jgi:hypothetical protein
VSAVNVAALFDRMPGPRAEATAWAAPFGDDLGDAWQTCPRGDWLLWLAGILEAPHSLLALAAADCAEFALNLLPLADHERVLLPLIDMCRQWVEGTVEAEECAQASRDVLAIYQEPGGETSDSPTAGYATAAVSAAVTVPTYTSALGISCACAAAALASAQVATPNDEDAIAAAHLRCSEIVRERVPFEALTSSDAFQRYALEAESGVLEE